MYYILFSFELNLEAGGVEHMNVSQLIDSFVDLKAHKVKCLLLIICNCYFLINYKSICIIKKL